MRAFFFSLFVLLTSTFASLSYSQTSTADLSGKTIKIVVQFPPGGVPDIVARVIGVKLSENLRATVIVENKPGATGAIAASYVKNSAPDGLTLLMGDSSSYSISPFIRTMTYDPVKDFVPISMVAQSLVVLITNPSRATNVREFIEMAKNKPGLPYSSSGVGSAHHLAMELLKSAAGIDLLHVPYRGTSESVPAVVSGDAVAAFAGLNVAKAFEKSGKIKILATVTAQRTKLAPEVPTFAELGLPGVTMNLTFAMFAPLKTPSAVVTKLNEEIAKIVASPGYAEQIGIAGLEPLGSTPEQVKALIEKEQTVYREVIRVANIKDN